MVFGIEESTKNTACHQRIKDDLDSIVSVISSVHNSIAVRDIRYCSHLGRYNESQCLRPMVVHFTAAADKAYKQLDKAAIHY